MQRCYGYQHWARFVLVFGVILGCGAVVELMQPIAFAQTAVTGGLSGTVADSSGAVVANATVTVMDTKTGSTRSVTTTSDGRYVVPFLPPSIYNVSASGNGLQSNTETTTVLLGHQTNLDLKATPAGTKQTIQISASAAQMIDTQSANLTTTFTEKQLEILPSPGGDITTIAYTAPGIVVNRGGSSGNFSSNGLPGNSNLYVLNGYDNVAAWNNNNSSGSSNNTIGQSEIAEAAVVQNGYSTQYGRAAGAIVTYTTKSGANAVHGEAYWLYNSDGLNANDFFNNHAGTPRQKAVSNQYAANIAGPIIHNKLFFYAGTEGLRYILPVNGYVNFPSAALQNTILHTVSPASASLYSQMFNLSNASAASQAAVNVTNGKGPLQDPNNALGCGTEAGTPVYSQANTYFGTVPKGATGTAIPCMTTDHATATNLNREWLFATRIDWNISEKHHLFGRFTDDQGEQPTLTSFINPILDAQSNQPEYTGQLNDTYSFSPNLTNQFILASNYTAAYFGPANLQATLQASPTLFYDPNNGGTTQAVGIGQGSYYGFRWNTYPSGRNVIQYQGVDDVSWLKGNHNLKFGVNFRRSDFTDFGPLTNTYGGYYTFNNFSDLAGGQLPGSDHSFFIQNFSQFKDAYLAVYNIGIYAQDEWQVHPNLKLTYGVRVDRTGNPLCTNDCFSFYQGDFPNSSATLSTPYNATISSGHGSAFKAIQIAVVQPRVGFAYDVSGQGKTVVRGGVGLFSDLFPALLAAQILTNFPSIVAPQVQAGTVSEASSGSAPGYAQASAQAAMNGYNQGQNFNQIKAALAANNVPFSPPTFTISPSRYQIARYLEWSMQVQHQLTSTDAIILSYAGNHGSHLLIQNLHPNQSLSGTAVTSFGGLPAVSSDPRFAQVRAYQNNAISNYNGATVTYKHIDHHGFTANVNYTYSHSLDDVSEGGTGNAYNSSSILTQIAPNGPSYLMYSNSDYDIRHNLSLDLVYQEANHFQNKIVDEVAGGWTVSAKGYWTSGEPFSVFNTKAGSSISNGTGGTQVLADVVGTGFSRSCNSFSSPCLQTPGIFNGTATQNNFGNLPRNSFRGPHYADLDASLLKSIVKLNRFQFVVGANAYNLFNHPNFANPQNNASLGNQGIINAAVSAPTSPYGAFEGSAVSGRVVQVQGRIIF